jgi:hypothetical protein
MLTEKRTAQEFGLKSLRGRDLSEDLVIFGRIILNWIL